ncbi:MAG: hypothetical protein ACLFVU_08195 [Phycisphaerae bacterium]
MRAVRITIALAVVFLVSAGSLADTLILNDGRVLEGKVVEKTRTRIRFEAHKYGAKVVMTYRTDQVREVKYGPVKKTETTKIKQAQETPAAKMKPEPKAPPVISYDKDSYYVIPFEGEVGVQVVTEKLERGFEDALKRQPTVVVVLFDSPGGYTEEVPKLSRVIRKYKGRLKIVAYVRRAVSAAAVTALSIQDIYFEPGAIFGAATAWQTNTFGMPETLEEKFNSIWRARARGIAEVGGHDPLIAEAMIDPKLELYARKDPDTGEITIHRGKKSGDQYTTITSKGKLLTMTGSEAENCGVSKGSAVNLFLLGKKLGHEDWVECTGLARPLHEHWKERLKTYNSEIETLAEEFGRKMQIAADENPETPELTYRYDPRTGRFAAESRRRWRKRSQRCARALMQAELNLNKAIELVSKFKEFEATHEYLEKLRARVKERRIKVVRETNKSGPDD